MVCAGCGGLPGPITLFPGGIPGVATVFVVLLELLPFSGGEGCWRRFGGVFWARGSSRNCCLVFWCSPTISFYSFCCALSGIYFSSEQQGGGAADLIVSVVSGSSGAVSS